MERGDDVTTCPMVSAEGKLHPCVFIFPLKKVSKKMVEAVPHGWLPLANKSGYMDESCFLKLLKHLRKQITCSPEDSKRVVFLLTVTALTLAILLQFIAKNKK